MQNSSIEDCDVLVIGGGPAGSTVAPLLVEQGYKVVLLEKTKHPRFHIGESLLPANMPLLKRLGVDAQVKAVGMVKNGAEFVSPWHDQEQNFFFADAIDKSMPSAYQVLRSDFDEILIRNAAKKGVTVHEECEVKRVDFLDDDQGAIITAKNTNHSNSSDIPERKWRARFVVDASGRDTFLSGKLNLKQRSEKHNSVAIYTHFSNADRKTGAREGDISIFWFDHGWFWYIPLLNGDTSIGMVTWPYFMKTRGERTLTQFFEDGINSCAKLKMRLQNATRRSDVTATGNYSYTSTRSFGKNFLLLGDAYAFIDPVFSSGVWLAMRSGEVASQTIDLCLSKPSQAQQALQNFDRQIKLGPKEFSWFIYRVTNPSMREMFMSPSEKYDMKAALLSLLAGDIYGHTPLQKPLRLLKGAYYLISLLNWSRTVRAWRQRRFSIRRVTSIENDVTSA